MKTINYRLAADMYYVIPITGLQAPACQVRALKIVKRAKGGSQASYVLTDGGVYVVKWQQNAQHRRILINEAISAVLLRILGIATPDWATVLVDQDFLTLNPDATVTHPHGLVRIEAGLHFGSKVPVDLSTVAVYDSFPSALLHRVVNLRHFISVLVFDCWVDHNDGRQAIFHKMANGRFKALMIDNGYTFGFDGAVWRMRDRPVVGCPLAPDIYLSDLASGQIELVIQAVQAIANQVRQIQCLLPREWIGEEQENLNMIFNQLVRRSLRLPDMVEAATDYMRSRTDHHHGDPRLRMPSRAA